MTDTDGASTTLFDRLIRVTFGLIYLQGPGSDHDEYDEDPDRDFFYNGLCSSAHRRGIALTTGRHDGVVPLRVELHERPPQVQPDWPEIVETSFTFAETHLVLTGYGGEVDLDLPGTGSYRFRYYASGMDEVRAHEPPAPEEPGADRYLLQLWPGPPGPDAILRESSAAAIEEHQVSRIFFPPPIDPRDRDTQLRETTGADEATSVNHATLIALKNVMGLPVRRAEVGWGSFLDLSFGDMRADGRANSLLWIEQASWRIESSTQVLVSSEDDRLGERVQFLNGRQLLAIEIDPATMDALFVFSGDVHIRTFSANSVKDVDFWHLFLPDGRVLGGESGPNWGLESADLQRPLGWVRPPRPSGQLPSRPLRTTPEEISLTRALDPLIGRAVVSQVDADDCLEVGFGDARFQVVSASWRVEKDGRVVVASSDDDLSRMAHLEGRVLQRISVASQSMDVTCSFDDGFALRTFAVHTDRDTPWVAVGSSGVQAGQEIE